MLAPLDTEPDAVALGRTLGQPAYVSPERRLWRAVIRQAIADRFYQGDDRRHTSYPAEETADATVFLFHSQRFLEICEMVALSPVSIREKLKQVERAMSAGILTDSRKKIPGRVAFVMGDITRSKFIELEGIKRAKRPKRNRRLVD